MHEAWSAACAVYIANKEGLVIFSDMRCVIALLNNANLSLHTAVKLMIACYTIKMYSVYAEIAP